MPMSPNSQPLRPVFQPFHTLPLHWASRVAQLVKSPPALWESPGCPWVRKLPWRRARLPTPVFLGFPGGLGGKESRNPSAVWETWVRSLGREDSLEKGNGNPLQYSCLETPMDRGAWRATVYGVAQSRTQLRDQVQSTDPTPPTAGGLDETHLHCPGPLTSPTHSSGLGIRLMVVYKGSQ